MRQATDRDWRAYRIARAAQLLAPVQGRYFQGLTGPPRSHERGQARRLYAYRKLVRTPSAAVVRRYARDPEQGNLELATTNDSSRKASSPHSSNY